jgi:heme-NO-binding protein
VKGVVFNLLEEVVIEHRGEAAWDELLDTTGLAGAYTSLGNYPDEDMAKLLSAAAGALGMPPEDTQRWFGREAMPLLARRYPAFFEGHKSTQSFVLSINNIIHPEVRKLYAGAHCPYFHFKRMEDGTLNMIYDSPRKLCALVYGFLEGAGDQFGETISVEHRSCMHKGDRACMLSIRYGAASAIKAHVA